jgi:hypothetical protein
MPRKKKTTASQPKTEVRVRNTYELSITLKKLLYQAVIVGLVAVGTFFVDFIIPQLTLEYPEYAIILVAITPIIVGILDWIKHRGDHIEEEIDSETGEVVRVLSKTVGKRTS